MCHRTVSGASGSSTPNLPPLGNSGRPLRYNSPDAPDCPVCQQSNGYFAPTVVCRGTVKVNSARLRAQKSEQHQKAHRTVNSDCLVHHWTVRWPTCQKLQRSEPNGRVTWLAHRTVSGGAPNYPVRHATEVLTNGHFGGWGYKYPQPPTIHHPSFQPSNLIQEL